jgi:ribonuclease P protein component
VSETWSRAVRLRRSQDFDRVQRGGRRIHGTNLVILHLANGTEAPRFGLAVSRKVGNAVVRNRVKRWLREALRRQRAGIGGVDVVVIARPPAAVAGYPALYEEVGSALRSLRGDAA